MQDSKKVLTRKVLYEGIQEFPWDDAAKRRFKFDLTDIARLESGKILWIGETAYLLEDPQ